MLTYKEVSRVLKYKKKDGLLIWTDRANLRVAEKEAGSKTKSGYIELSYIGHRLYAHRVIWLLVYGVWPDGQIDHINGVRHDNRMGNLRVVSNQENHKNMKRHKGNSSGVSGVYWSKRAKKWQSYICVDGKQTYLGVFKNLDDAAKTRKNAEEKYEYHKNHGRKTFFEL